MDELRISNSLRYNSTFTPSTDAFTTDANTMALYHFDEGTGTTVADSSGATGGPSNGTVSVGGSPTGPEWSTDTPFTTEGGTPTPTVTPSITPSLTPTLTPTGAPNPALFPDSTRFGRVITIDNTGGAELTNYQVLYQLDTETLINENKLQADCDDIRFTNATDDNQLDYWIETGTTNACDTANTNIWVEIPTIPANATTRMYLYYGNAALAIGSNGATTFPFFDTFTSFNSSIWTSTNGASGYSQSGSTITINSGALYSNAAVSTVTNPNFTAEALVQWTSSDAGQSGINIADTPNTASSNGTGAALSYLIRGNSSTDLFGLAATGSNASYDIAGASNSVGSITNNTPYILGTTVTSSSIVFSRNRTVLQSPAGTWAGTNNPYIWLGYFSGQNAGSTNIADLQVDWVLIRRDVPTEPVLQTGSEVQNAVPDAPVVSDAIAGNQQVVLSWSAPSDNGDAITDYVVQYALSGSGSYSTFNDGTSTSVNATVTGLTNGTTYDFRVAAVNSNGTGAFSSTISATPLSATPNAPEAQSVTISGTARVGQTLTGTYTYYDENGDAESGTTVRWLRASSAGGTYSPISGATSSTYVLTEADEDQYIRFAVTPRSVAVPTTGDEVLSSATGPVEGVTYYNHILMIGQSFTIGYDGNPALSTTQPYTNLKLNASNTALVSLVEDENPTSDNVNANVESPGSALGNTITNLSPSESYRTLISKSAVPGAPYADLQQGTTPYNNALAQVTAAKSLVENDDFEHRVVALANLHGPADRLNASSYESYLNEWQSDYQTDIFAVTGQTGSLPMFIDQSSNFTAYNDGTSPLVIAQLAAAQNNPNIYMVGPKYQFTYTNTDGIHLLNQGYRWLGEYYGKAMKRVLIDGDTTTALVPNTVVRSGNTITIQFDVPEPPIAIDTTRVLAQTDYGFEYYDDAVSSDIDSVSVDGDDVIRITLDNTPTGADQRLRYAYTGTPGALPGAQQSGSARGNIRDSDDTESLYGNDLYNWLVHFDEPITVDENGPSFSNVAFSSPSPTSIRSTWNTNEAASSQLHYGLVSYVNSTSENNTTSRVTSHDETITGLLPCAVYQVRVAGRDLPLNLATTTGTQVTTSGCTGSADPQGSESELINSTTGGTLIYDPGSGEKLRITAPANYLGSDVVFQAIHLDGSDVLSATGNPSGLSGLAGYLYELNALTGLSAETTTFDEPVQVTITYDDNDLGTIEEGSLRIMRWNGSEWEGLSNNSLDTITNSVSGYTTQFSLFGLFGQDTSPTLAPSPTPSVPLPGVGNSSSGSSGGGSVQGSTSGCSVSSPGRNAPWIFSAVSNGTDDITIYYSQAQEPFDHYVLQFGTQSGQYQFGASNIGGKETKSYTIESLSPNTMYYIRVRGGNGCAPGPWSNEISVRTGSSLQPRYLQTTNIAFESTAPTLSVDLESTLKDVQPSPSGSSQTEQGERSPLAQKEYTLYIRVIDPQKNAIQGATVKIPGLSLAQTTDTNGIATFTKVPAGQQKLLIEADGFAGEQSVSLEGETDSIRADITVEPRQNFFVYWIGGGIALLLLIFGIRKYRKSRIE